MSNHLVVQVADVRVGVDLLAGDADRLRRELASIVVDGSTTAPPDVSVQVRGTETEDVLAAVTRAAVTVTSSLLVHAGAVMHEGQALLFPGESGTGKSTMIAACVRAGMPYLTDEMVAFDLQENARITGWPRPLMLTPWSATQFGLPVGPETAKTVVPPAGLGAAVEAGSVGVGHVVVVRIGAERDAVETISPGQVITAILRSSFNHYRFGEAAWRTAVGVAERASGWRLDVATGRHPDRAVTQLRQVLDA
ncbi:MAG TPA: hypothetical protein VK053_21805 [Jiangellaceae bacterium]|nr:hypothetical protein [Jiangellaceae bacterium]